MNFKCLELPWEGGCHRPMARPHAFESMQLDLTRRYGSSSSSSHGRWSDYITLASSVTWRLRKKTVRKPLLSSVTLSLSLSQTNQPTGLDGMDVKMDSCLNVPSMQQDRFCPSPPSLPPCYREERPCLLRTLRCCKTVPTGTIPYGPYR